MNFALNINGNRFLYQDLRLISSMKSGDKPPTYVHATYQEGFLADLQRLAERTNVSHILLFFNNADFKYVLQHINVFESFTYTLIPRAVTQEIYETIFQFFFESPRSLSCITWALKLITKPSVAIADIRIAGDPLSTATTCGICPLQGRNCSKQYLLTELIHPSRPTPSKEEMDVFCSLHLKYSIKAYEILQKALIEGGDEIEFFTRMKESIGERSRHWLDTYGIF